MRLNPWAVALALASFSMTGCFWRGEKTQPAAFTVRSADAGAQTNLVISPTKSSVGRIESFNKQANFVVIDFPIGQAPANGTAMSIFRAGQKVGTLKISPETLENLRIGDITSGSGEKGDEVRAE